MNTITDIVQAHGYNSVHDMDIGDHIKVEQDHQMPLTIEKIGDNRLSVAHYYTQRGDMMSDPETVSRAEHPCSMRSTDEKQSSTTNKHYQPQTTPNQSDAMTKSTPSQTQFAP